MSTRTWGFIRAAALTLCVIGVIAVLRNRGWFWAVLRAIIITVLVLSLIVLTVRRRSTR
jgi:hypothetical protein